MFAEKDPEPKPYYGYHSYGYHHKPHFHGMQRQQRRKKSESIFDRIRNFLTGGARSERNQNKKMVQNKFDRRPRNTQVFVQQRPAFKRRYGFRCQVTLVDRSKCQLNVDCDIDGNRLTKRQSFTGEEFRTDAPPDCRIELSPSGCTDIP